MDTRVIEYAILSFMDRMNIPRKEGTIALTLIVLSSLKEGYGRSAHEAFLTSAITALVGIPMEEAEKIAKDIFERSKK
jgi:hypothetical protein